MELTDFENLARIPKLEKDIEDLKALLVSFINTNSSNRFSTKTDVAKFLGVTPRTVTNMILDNRLKEGIHYLKQDFDKITFVESSILSLKNRRENEDI